MHSRVLFREQVTTAARHGPEAAVSMWAQVIFKTTSGKSVAVKGATFPVRVTLSRLEQVIAASSAWRMRLGLRL